jgi:GYF domain 2
MEEGAWFCEINGERRGPLSLLEMKQLVASGVIRRQTPVWPPGADETQPGTPAGEFLAFLTTAQTDENLKYLLPVGRSGWAIAAGYLGLFSIIPFVSYAALFVSIYAAIQLKKNPKKLGWGRVITGLVLSSLFSLIYTIAFSR